MTQAPSTRSDRERDGYRTPPQRGAGRSLRSGDERARGWLRSRVFERRAVTLVAAAAAGNIVVTMTDIEANLRAVRARCDEAQRRGGHARPVTLVAVSKRKPEADIEAAHRAGCVDFGENYVQELVDKHAALGALDLRWHFIGHLQRNKVKQLLAVRPSLIHGVDDARLLREIDKRAGGEPRAVLLQVNVSGEASKSGCSPAEAPALTALAHELSGVRLRGLMTMPPIGEPEAARVHFRALRELADAIGRDQLPELSMGMSHDFEIAIEEGATLVRVGTAIFGERA